MKFSPIPLLFATVIMSAQAADVLPGVLKFQAYSPALAASGQPKRSQFSDIAAAGYQVIINVASPDSNPAGLHDEKQLVESAGMTYFLIPIKWDKPDVNQVIEAVKLLERLEGQNVLIHCYVNSRASLVTYLFRASKAGAIEADEKAKMTKIWKQNRGYELENMPQWQFLLEDAKERLKR